MIETAANAAVLINYNLRARGMLGDAHPLTEEIGGGRNRSQQNPRHGIATEGAAVLPRVCEKKWRTFNREALGGLRKEIRNTPPPRAPKEGGGPRAPREAPLAKGTSKETEANQQLALLAQDRFGQE